MNKPQLFEVETLPAGAAKEARPYHTMKVIATAGRVFELLRDCVLRDADGSGLAE